MRSNQCPDCGSPHYHRGGCSDASCDCDQDAETAGGGLDPGEVVCDDCGSVFDGPLDEPAMPTDREIVRGSALDALHGAVNDIYTAMDEGEIEQCETLRRMAAACAAFLGVYHGR